MPKSAPITTTVSQPVEAKLMLVPEFGPKRDATPLDLRQMGYVHGSSVYMAAYEALTRLVGLDPAVHELTRWQDGHSVANLVRYFVECAIMYHDLGDGYPADYHEMADRIVAHFAEAGGNEGNGPALRAALSDQYVTLDREYRAGQRLMVNDMPCTLLRVNPKHSQALGETDDGRWVEIDFNADTIEALPDPWADTDGTDG